MLATALAFALLINTSPTLAEVRNKHAVAVIIGNKNYTHERVPEVSFAHRDAKAMKHFVIDVLGYDPKNVIHIEDANQGKMASTFGKEGNHKGLLWRAIGPRGRADVLVYYSGHGVPGQEDQRGYLLPADADPATAELNGFPVDLLYANLAKLGAKSVTVLLDACFTGDSHGGKLIQAASPVYLKAKMLAPPKNITVLTAAGAGQLASWDEKRKHGLFTDSFLDGAYGAADADKDGRVTLAEMRLHLSDTMTVAARRTYGRVQEATVFGADETVLAALSPLKAPARKPVGPEIGTTFKDCAACPEMIVIPPGSFLMGSKIGWREAGSQYRETYAELRPMRVVAIPKAVAVGKFEVTFSEWEACVDAGGCSAYRPNDRKWGRGERPVIYVNWDDAQSYVQWLSRLSGSNYRLMSEAEWEYAARGGTTTLFFWGDQAPVCRRGERHGAKFKGEKDCDFVGTEQVGSYGANPFGLFDMHGNVWEWVADCYEGSYLNAPFDGRPVGSPNETCKRVLRGGSWQSYAKTLIVTRRAKLPPSERSYSIGFRVARD